MSKKVDLGELLIARLGGDVVSDIGARVGTYSVKHFLSMPYHALTHHLSHHVILPNLDKFEAQIDKMLPGVETAASRVKRMSKPAEARAKKIAEVAVDLGADTVFGLVTQVIGQQWIDKRFNVGKITDGQQTATAFMDRACQIGAFITLNTVGAKPNKAAQKALVPFYKKLAKDLGVEMSQDSAEEYASVSMNVRATGIVGTLGALLMHNHYARGGK